MEQKRNNMLVLTRKAALGDQARKGTAVFIAQGLLTVRVERYTGSHATLRFINSTGAYSMSTIPMGKAATFEHLQLKVIPLRSSRDGLTLGFVAPREVKILRDDARVKTEQKRAA